MRVSDRLSALWLSLQIGNQKNHVLFKCSLNYYIYKCSNFERAYYQVRTLPRDTYVKSSGSNRQRIAYTSTPLDSLNVTNTRAFIGSP